MRKLSIVLLTSGLAAACIAAWTFNRPRAAVGAATSGAKAETTGPRTPDGPTTRPSAGGPSRYSRYSRSRPLTEEQEKEVLEYLKEKRPDLHKQAMEYREEDPDRYSRMIRPMHYFIQGIKGMAPELREAHEIRQSTRLDMWRLARELIETKDDRRKKEIRLQMHEQADKNFDAEQTVRQDRLRQLAEQIKQMQEDLKERARDRETVIVETVERMISSAEAYQERSERDGRQHPGPRPDGPPRGGPPEHRDGPRPKPTTEK